MFCKKIPCPTFGQTMFFYKFWNAMMSNLLASMAKAPLSLQKVHSEKLSGENVYSKHKNK
jgi:hypothetical protein